MVLSSDKDLDALYHQRLAVLRNSSGAADAVHTILQARWAWRRTGGGVNRKALPIALVSGLIAVAFIIAGMIVHCA